MQRLKKRNKLVILTFIGFFLLVTGSVILAQGSTPFIGWKVFSNGGGLSTAPNVSIQSTLGEPIVGRSSNGNGDVELHAGYQQGDVVAPAITPVATQTPRGEKIYLPLIVKR